MTDITLEMLGGGLVFIVGLIASVTALKKSLKEGISELLDDKFEKIDEKIDKIESKLDSVERDSCKNYIVPYLADMERGGIPDEIERQRFWDAYQLYIKDGGNSYIQDRVKKLQREGKI